MRVLYQSNNINNHNTAKKKNTTNILYIFKENIYTLQIFIMISNFFDLLASLIQKPSSNYTHLRPYHSRQISISERVVEIHQKKEKNVVSGSKCFLYLLNLHTYLHTVLEMMMLHIIANCK